MLLSLFNILAPGENALTPTQITAFTTERLSAELGPAGTGILLRAYGQQQMVSLTGIPRLKKTKQWFAAAWSHS